MVDASVRFEIDYLRVQLRWFGTAQFVFRVKEDYMEFLLEHDQESSRADLEDCALDYAFTNVAPIAPNGTVDRAFWLDQIAKGIRTYEVEEGRKFVDVDFAQETRDLCAKGSETRTHFEGVYREMYPVEDFEGASDEEIQKFVDDEEEKAEFERTFLKENKDPTPNAQVGP